MPAPTITVSPASGPTGTKVTVTVVRDTPPAAETITAKTAIGTGTATFTVVEDLAVTVSNGAALTKVSDDGTTYIATFIA